MKYRLQYNSWILRRCFSCPNSNIELANMKIAPLESNISSLRRYIAKNAELSCKALRSITSINFYFPSGLPVSFS